MNKLYSALEKLSNSVNEAQTTNSVYYQLSNLTVRVSDHTCSHMSTIDPCILHILTNESRKSYYTVCYLQTVQVMLYSEVLAVCKGLALMSTSLVRHKNNPTAALLAKKNKESKCPIHNTISNKKAGQVRFETFENFNKFLETLPSDDSSLIASINWDKWAGLTPNKVKGTIIHARKIFQCKTVVPLSQMENMVKFLEGQLKMP